MDEYPYSEHQFNMSMNEHTGMIDLTKTPVSEYQFITSDKPNEILFGKKPVMTEPTNHLWKYNEDKILKDIQDYVTSTYRSHYCGHQQEHQGVQTIDLMAAKELASDFCQANILKYEIGRAHV